MNSLKKFFVLLFICLGTFLSSCDNLFEYSPYVANVDDEYLNTTSINLELLKGLETNSDTFKFAFISDNHYHYTNLRTVVDDINNRNDISFTLFGGDIADQALLKEYELFYKVMEHMNGPYLTVIGNHDYKSNGEAVYRRMFGAYNYSFVFNNSKFILFDNTVWESDKTPNFDWLSNQLADNSLYNEVFVVSHIPPFGDQLTPEMEITYSSLIRDNNVKLSIHGHAHVFALSERYNDSVKYLIGPWLKNPSYCIVTVLSDSYHVELVKL